METGLDRDLEKLADSFDTGIKKLISDIEEATKDANTVVELKGQSDESVDFLRECLGDKYEFRYMGNSLGVGNYQNYTVHIIRRPENA